MAVAKIVAAIDHGHRELSLSSTAGTQLERSRIDHERTHEAGRFTVLALSPHLDDAVMSVGASLAALAEAGSQVMLCTVFAGAPAPPLSEAARVFHAHCGLADDGVAVRRAEDESASAAIGTHPCTSSSWTPSTGASTARGSTAGLMRRSTPTGRLSPN